MNRRSGTKRIKVQVIPMSGKGGKPRMIDVAPGATAANVLGTLGIGLTGKKLSFCGKPIGADDALFQAGTKLRKGPTLAVEEHAQGS
jgi:hypothetical protein